MPADPSTKPSLMNRESICLGEEWELSKSSIGNSALKENIRDISEDIKEIKLTIIDFEANKTQTKTLQKKFINIEDEIRELKLMANFEKVKVDKNDQIQTQEYQRNSFGDFNIKNINRNHPEPITKINRNDIEFSTDRIQRLFEKTNKSNYRTSRRRDFSSVIYLGNKKV